MGAPSHPPSPRHRRLLLLRGDPARTRAQAEAMLGSLPAEAVAWVSSEAPERAFTFVRPNQLAARLGQAFDVVVIDAHAGLDADRLGQAHGMVRGGGALLLRLPDASDRPAHGPARLAAFPYRAEHVGRRFEDHVEAVLDRHASPLPARLAAAGHRTAGTREQAELVARLIDRWARAEPTRTAVVAERGRGKSSALGLALRSTAPAQTDRGDLIVTAGTEAAAGELLRFAGEAARFVPLLELLAEPRAAAVIVVDEAAQVPVPLLQRLVTLHGHAHLAFASTTHGYEGTGRGFSLRFLTWLEDQRPPVERCVLHQPIRWAADDPLERAVYEALLLDAEPAALEPEPEPSFDPARVRTRTLDRDALARDLPRLRELFGLLVHAHYRTTPGDLHRLLDAPNLRVHAALLHHQDDRDDRDDRDDLDDRIIAATVVAEEGGLPPSLCEQARAGRTRLRAHALADVLVAHLGRAEAGALRMRRSVRIAVHPALRRRKLATRLVEHVHASETADGAEVDLFGTLFGATPELLRFRRGLGYELVRVSASRGARSGEPSVMMLRPLSAAARELVAELRRELARELEAQLALLEADDALPLEPELVAALRRGLPAVEPYTEAERRACVRAYAYGPRTFDSVATAVRGFVASADLDRLPPDLRAVVEGRALHFHGWRRVTRDAGLASVPTTMRALRRAIRTLL